MKGKAGVWVGRTLFLLPAFILFIAFFIYPFIFTIATSFTSWHGIGSMQFNGAANYIKLFADNTFRLGVRNNIIWALCQGFIQIPLACIVAMILARHPKGWRSMRTIYYMPNVISTVAIAMVWKAMYNTSGPINTILKTLVGMQPVNWLGDPTTALAAVIFQTVIYVGYFMIIIFASAENVPQELYEASMIDGASPFQQTWYVTLPMLRGTIVTVMTIAMAYGVRHFEATYLMTQGGPAYATTTLGINLYNKMDALRYNEASAMGVCLIILGTVVIVLLRKIFGTSDPMAEAAQ
jgi:raffinose/stachyose/melibiose transport system permease protein